MAVSQAPKTWGANCLPRYTRREDIPRCAYRLWRLAPASAAGHSPGWLHRVPEPSPHPHLKQPDVFLKTVVHSASLGLESSLGSRSQPEWGTMTSWVSVCRPWSMMTIFRGS